MWVLDQNDATLLAKAIKQKMLGDFHSSSVVGTDTDGQDIYGYPIMKILASIEKPGHKGLAYTFFTEVPADGDVDNSSARGRLIKYADLPKLWYLNKEADQVKIPEALKQAQNLANRIDAVPTDDNFNARIKAVLGNP